MKGNPYMIAKEESFKKLFDKYKGLTIDKDSFQKGLDIYSEFLTIIDSDFCYNQTFLREYVNDLYDFQQKLLRKESIYEKVLELCEAFDYDYIIELDGTFTNRCETNGEKNRKMYYGLSDRLNIRKIMDDQIHIYFEKKDECDGLIKSIKYDLSESKEENHIIAIDIIEKLIGSGQSVNIGTKERNVLDGKDDGAIQAE